MVFLAILPFLYKNHYPIPFLVSEGHFRASEGHQNICPLMGTLQRRANDFGVLFVVKHICLIQLILQLGDTNFVGYIYHTYLSYLFTVTIGHTNRIDFAISIKTL